MMFQPLMATDEISIFSRTVDDLCLESRSNAVPVGAM